MRIYEWNIGMAATIPSNQGYNLKEWVIDEIVKDAPDCIILTEFVAAPGIDYYFQVLKKNNYHWFISNSTKYNGILIALKEVSFDFKNTFDYRNSITTVKNNEVLNGPDLPDFYEVRVEWEGQPLSIIGIRIRIDISGKNPSFKTNQFEALDNYLSQMNHNVICIGDFNAYWGGTWSTNENKTLNRTSQKYSLYTPKINQGEWYSFITRNGKRIQLDHLITNLNNKKIECKYDWTFINPVRYKPHISAETPDKPKGLPDHAILKALISPNQLDNI